MSKAAKRPPRRPFIDAAHAAALLGCDPRTVRKMVSDGRLEGEKVPSVNDQRFEWRIYADQPGIERARSTEGAAAASADASAGGDSSGLSGELAELRAATAEDRARRAEAQNTQLAAALEAMNEVLGEFQKAAELAQKTAELARESAEISQQSNTHFQSGSAAMSKVMSALLDTLAMNNIPDSPEGLELP
jgi:hypothetical protein